MCVSVCLLATLCFTMTMTPDIVRSHRPRTATLPQSAPGVRHQPNHYLLCSLRSASPKNDPVSKLFRWSNSNLDNQTQPPKLQLRNEQCTTNLGNRIQQSKHCIAMFVDHSSTKTVNHTVREQLPFGRDRKVRDHSRSLRKISRRASATRRCRFELSGRAVATSLSAATCKKRFSNDITQSRWRYECGRLLWYA